MNPSHRNMQSPQQCRVNIFEAFAGIFPVIPGPYFMVFSKDPASMIAVDPPFRNICSGSGGDTSGLCNPIESRGRSDGQFTIEIYLIKEKYSLNSFTAT